jgi:hypothetical protein
MDTMSSQRVLTRGKQEVKEKRGCYKTGFKHGGQDQEQPLEDEKGKK